jgi:hypothetical protein
MGLPKRSTAQDELFSYGWEIKASTKGERPGSDDLLDDSDPIGAARGMVLGVFFGAIIWGVILSVLL